MKNIFKTIILSAILITPTLCGCTSQDGDIATTLFTSSVNEYQYYHGTEYKEIDVSQLPYSINVNIIKSSGVIDIDVYQNENKNNYLYKGRDIPSSSFQIVISKIGKYQLRVNANEFIGILNIDSH